MSACLYGSDPVVVVDLTLMSKRSGDGSFLMENSNLALYSVGLWVCISDVRHIKMTSVYL